MTTPIHVHEIHIRTTPDAVWTAMTDGEQTSRYFFGTIVKSSWEPGDPVIYDYPDGSRAADGDVIAVDEPSRLEMTFVPRWDPAAEAEGPCRMVWAVDELPGTGVVKLAVEYYDLDPDGVQIGMYREGIPLIVSGMKTLLETGEPMMGG